MKTFLVLSVLLSTLFLSGGKATSYGQVNAELTAQYEQDNDDYFDGNLPHALVFNGAPKGDLGLTRECFVHGTDAHFCIFISNHLAFSDRLQGSVLLHEECHVATWDPNEEPHGKRWQHCMHNLAKEGAFDDLW